MLDTSERSDPNGYSFVLERQIQLAVSALTRAACVNRSSQGMAWATGKGQKFATAHKGLIGDIQGAQGDLPQNPRTLGNPLETICWEGLGPNQLAQRPPGCHTIHSSHGKAHTCKFGNRSQTKPCLSGPQICSNHRPGRVRSLILDPRPKFGSQVQKLVPGNISNTARLRILYKSRSATATES